MHHQIQFLCLQMVTSWEKRWITDCSSFWFLSRDDYPVIINMIIIHKSIWNQRGYSCIRELFVVPAQFLSSSPTAVGRPSSLNNMNGASVHNDFVWGPPERGLIGGSVQRPQTATAVVIHMASHLSVLYPSRPPRVRRTELCFKYLRLFWTHLSVRHSAGVRGSNCFPSSSFQSVQYPPSLTTPYRHIHQRSWNRFWLNLHKLDSYSNFDSF